MKKLLLFSFALLLTHSFSAQVKMYEYPVGELTSQRISAMIDASRKNGMEEWELQILEKNLNKKLSPHSASGAKSNNPSRTATTCSLDFEQGNYTGWTLNSGNINGVTLPCNACANTPGGIANMASLSNSGPMWTNGGDIASGLPVVGPGGGNYALALNDKSTGGKIMRMEQSFQVTSSNSIFSFMYMAVLENPAGHTPSQKPYFQCQVLDQNNSVISCTYYYSYTSSTMPGWYASSTLAGVMYKPWSTVLVSLNAYVGQTVTLQFIVSDCNAGGHFGYAYLDGLCGAPQVNAVSNTLCQGNTSTTLSAPAGFTSYNWFGPGITGAANQQNVQVNAAGTYSVIANGTCGGAFTDTMYFSVQNSTNTAPLLTVNGNTGLCAAGSTTLTASGASSYTWNSGTSSAFTSSVAVTPSVTTVYTVTGYNFSSQCASTLSVPVLVDQCVWPGDANEDLVVDNTDLLPVGVKFGMTGAVRNTTGNTWQGDACQPWNDTLSNGKNTKYTDCNGDGIIDFNDTLAINLNYALTHVARQQLQSQTVNADLFLVFDKTQYMPGDTLNADVFIGSSTHTQSNFYGAAFSLSYDPSFVQPGTEKFWFNNSWVGNINQQKIKFRRLNTTTGNVAASLVRITHTDTSGFGKVARLQFVIKNPIADTMLHFTISNVVKTNAAGMQTSLTGGVDSVSVINQGTNIYSGTGTKIALYPNPAKHTVTVNGLLPQQDIRIYSLLGNEVLRTVAIGGRNTIDLSSLPAGIYILQAGAERIRFVKE